MRAAPAATVAPAPATPVVTIEDDVTPLAGGDEVISIEDDETPLAEGTSQTKAFWWILLLVAGSATAKTAYDKKHNKNLFRNNYLYSKIRKLYPKM